MLENVQAKLKEYIRVTPLSRKLLLFIHWIGTVLFNELLYPCEYFHCAVTGVLDC